MHGKLIKKRVDTSGITAAVLLKARCESPRYYTGIPLYESIGGASKV